MNEKSRWKREDDLETEVTTKLNGIIFRKAEIGKDFESVYLKVFEKMVEMEIFGFETILEVLGDVGG